MNCFNNKTYTTQLRRWTKDLNTQYSKEDMQMVNKHVKRYPSSFIIRKMKSKPQWLLTHCATATEPAGPGACAPQLEEALPRAGCTLQLERGPAPPLGKSFRSSENKMNEWNILKAQWATTPREIRTIVIKKLENTYWLRCGEIGTLRLCWWECKFVHLLWNTVW